MKINKNNTRKYLLLSCFISIVVLTCSYLKSNRSNYVLFQYSKIYSPINLEKLRKQMKENESHILDKVPKIKNLDGTCYFSTCVQAMAANKNFVSFFINNDFDKKAIVLRIVQNLICKLYADGIINLHLEMELLRKCIDKNVFDLNGGETEECYSELLKYIQKEIELFNINQNDILHNINYKTTFYCSLCSKHKNKTRTTTDIIDLKHADYKKFYSSSNFAKHSLNFPYHICKNFLVKKYDKKEEVILPNTIVFSLPNKFVNNIKAVYDLNPHFYIKIDNKDYELNAINCYYEGANELHAAIYVKRNSQWFFCSDTQVEEVFLENEEIARNFAKTLVYVAVDNN